LELVAFMGRNDKFWGSVSTSGTARKTDLAELIFFRQDRKNAQRGNQ
jgi:hypothetical protein